MENGRLTDFLDSILFQQTEWAYKDRAYLTDGIIKHSDGMYEFFVFETNLNGQGGDEIYRFSASTSEECVKEFKNAKIYNGRSFMEIESEVRWIDL